MAELSQKNPSLRKSSTLHPGVLWARLGRVTDVGGESVVAIMAAYDNATIAKIASPLGQSFGKLRANGLLYPRGNQRQRIVL